MSAFCIFAKIQVKPDYRSNAEKTLKEQVDITLKEGGCYAFRLLQSNENPNIFHLYEEFESEESLNTHLAQDYTKRVFERFETWLEKPLDATKMTLIK